MDASELSSILRDYCREQIGDPDATVANVTALDGHSGLTFGFDLRYRRDGQPVSEALVLRIPAAGVRPVGPSDMLRQARLLRALAGTPVPVPPVRWADARLPGLDRPFHITRRMSGQTLKLTAGEWGAALSPARLERIAHDTLRALAALHQVDWRRDLADWGPPPTLEEEVLRWDWMLKRNRETAQLPELVAGSPAVRERLLARPPSLPRIGIRHGDFQWSNVLYEPDGRLVSIVDWELASVGPVLLDLGWLMAFSDPDNWLPPRRAAAPLPPPTALVAFYEQASGEPAQDVHWYRAYACYVFALITGFNLDLHRRGKRPDPLWEDIALSATNLLDRAQVFLDWREGEGLSREEISAQIRETRGHDE